MKIKGFRDFTIWQEAKALAKDIYILSNDYRFAHDFGFKDQIRRSTVSIASNIAEGFERDSKNEFIRFLRIAKGSAGELSTQIIIASEIDYLNSKNSGILINRIGKLSASIGKLIRYLETNRLVNELTRN